MEWTLRATTVIAFAVDVPGSSVLTLTIFAST